MKTPTNKMIARVIDRVVKSLQRTNFDQLQLAVDLLYAFEVINWRKTEYRGWTPMCEKHIPMAHTTIYSYIHTAELINKFNYSKDEAQNIIKNVGWVRFGIGLRDLRRKMKVATFIKRYKFDQERDANTSADTDGDRVYMFSLPKAYADKLDMYLIDYGMRIGPKKRSGVRDAFKKLIDKKLK